MKPSIIKSKDELPMFMSVMDLIDLLGISRSSAYELAAEEGFPKLKLVPGRVIIPRDRLLEWLDDHTSYMAGWGARPQNEVLLLADDWGLCSKPQQRLKMRRWKRKQFWARPHKSPFWELAKRDQLPLIRAEISTQTPIPTGYSQEQDKAEARLDTSHRPATPSGGDLRLFQAFLQGLWE